MVDDGSKTEIVVNSGSGALFSYKDLTTGRYRLTEKQAPSGYSYRYQTLGTLIFQKMQIINWLSILMARV
ncbi:SpaA isopeptide-forming pilin-related protein [Aerococcus sp. 1KP-2016]|uniref:SpaA isopeptide-forming pilin-related protein n=1 Tax=Aerococcus sp. 1KP-2016 TaxID=1981982 RepID=UPI0035180B35